MVRKAIPARPENIHCVATTRRSGGGKGREIPTTRPWPGGEPLWSAKEVLRAITPFCILRSFWRGGRAAEGAPLLREYGLIAHRGFESLPLRHYTDGPAGGSASGRRVGPRRRVLRSDGASATPRSPPGASARYAAVRSCRPCRSTIGPAQPRSHRLHHRTRLRCAPHSSVTRIRGPSPERSFARSAVGSLVRLYGTTCVISPARRRFFTPRQ